MARAVPGCAARRRRSGHGRGRPRKRATRVHRCAATSSTAPARCAHSARRAGVAGERSGRIPGHQQRLGQQCIATSARPVVHDPGRRRPDRTFRHRTARIARPIRRRVRNAGCRSPQEGAARRRAVADAAVPGLVPRSRVGRGIPRVGVRPRRRHPLSAYPGQWPARVGVLPPPRHQRVRGHHAACAHPRPGWCRPHGPCSTRRSCSRLSGCRPVCDRGRPNVLGRLVFGKFCQEDRGQYPVRVSRFGGVAGLDEARRRIHWGP